MHSKSKFWQMIGRGTRLRPFGPGEDKKDFLVFDWCGNLEYFSSELPSAETQMQPSLAERLFEARLELITALEPVPYSALPNPVVELVETTQETTPTLRASIAATLHSIVAGMNLDNFLVRPYRRTVERFSRPEAWQTLAAEDAAEVSTLAGLPSSVRDDDEAAKRFDLVMLRAQLAELTGDGKTANKCRIAVQEAGDALLAMTNIPVIRAQAETLETVSGDDWWQDVTLQMLEDVRKRIRGLIGLIPKAAKAHVYTDFEDTLGEATEIELTTGTPGMNSERFKSKVEAYLNENLDNLALQRLRRNRQLTPDDLVELERLLVEAGGPEVDFNWISATAGGLGVFIRSLVGLDRAAVSEAFSQFLDGSKHNASQIRYVTMIVDELTKNGVMEPARLYEAPYTDIAATGPDLLFPMADVQALAQTMRTFSETATAAAR